MQNMKYAKYEHILNVMQRQYVEVENIIGAKK